MIERDDIVLNGTKELAGTQAVHQDRCGELCRKTFLVPRQNMLGVRFGAWPNVVLAPKEAIAPPAYQVRFQY